MDKEELTQQDTVAQTVNDFLFLDSRRYENHIRSESHANG